MQKTYTVVTIALTSAMGALLLPGVPLAQETADDVVISTGFRPQSLSGSTGSTAVIDSSLIDSRGAVHLETVLGTVGNVTLSSASSRSRFVQIRGIGDLEQFVDPKHFPSVGITIDGIDVGGLASAAMLFDVSRIEILRGPQGTQYGATGLAGQVNILSRAPDTRFDAYLDAGIGDFGAARVGIAAGGPLGESLSGRIAVHHHRGDGYIENSWLGRDDTAIAALRERKVVA